MIASAADDAYATAKPKEEFHKRIDFSLDMHAEAVRAMRYPPGAFRKDEAALMEARQREDEEAAVAKAIEESDFMGGGDGDDDDDDEDEEM
jgi:26S proteasome regulatory subunit N3